MVSGWTLDIDSIASFSKEVTHVGWPLPVSFFAAMVVPFSFGVQVRAGVRVGVRVRVRVRDLGSGLGSGT